MAGVELRDVGSTATNAPIIKRGVVTLTDGRCVALFVDANHANASGSDETGVAKIYLYVSNDVSRTAFTMAIAYTPPVAPTSTTRPGVMSLSAGADNSVWVAWQGTDNALYCTRWSYSAGTLTFVANETVVAAGAITNRFRTIDMDITGNATAVIGAYEANAASGIGAWHRAYVRNNSGTWVRSVSISALSTTTHTIRAGSEDMSVSIRGDGVSSNVIRYLMYATKTHTTGDLGDLITEVQYNVSTGTADSGVRIGTWFSDLNKNQAAGTRRAMIYTISSSLYLVAGVAGAGVPKFWATKLTTGNYGTPAISTAGYVASVTLSNYFKIDPQANQRTYWSTSYKDNRLIFGFAGLGTGSAPRIFREVSMSWPNVGTAAAKPTVDLVPRPLDSAYYGEEFLGVVAGPIGIYGGDNKRTQAGLKYYNFLAFYGRANNFVNPDEPETWWRDLRFVSEDTFDAPHLITPYSGSAEPTNRPNYRVRVENVNLQPNLYGKIEVQVATDNIFTTNVKTITQADSEFRYFGSKDGLSGGVTQLAIPSPSTASLNQGSWYWRARIISDKDTPGAWSDAQQFTVSHPPVAMPLFPLPASVIPRAASNLYNFSWSRSDTDPSDSQTAYQVIIRRLDTGVNILDTGFVASSATSVALSLDVDALGISEVSLDWRVTLQDADGVTGPTSNAVQFAIGEVPELEVLTPSHGVPVDTALPTVTWNLTTFGGRIQRAYRISIYNNNTPNTLTNPSFETGTLTGWTAQDGMTPTVQSTTKHSGTWAVSCVPNGVGGSPRLENVGPGVPVVAGEPYMGSGFISPATANKQVQIRLNWYDGSSAFIGTQTQNYDPEPGNWQLPTITATAPVGAAFVTVGLGLAGTPAAGDTFVVDDMSLNVAGVDLPEPLIDTFWRVGTENSYTFTTQVLEDDEQYRVVVEVQDDGGLIVLQDVPFSTDWTEPDLASGQTVTVPDQFKVRIEWDNSGQDPDFVAYRVYRRYMVPSIVEFDVENTAETWRLIYETEEQLTDYTFDDYLCPLNKPTDYVVVQLVDRFGSLIESNITAFSTVTLTADRYYFVPTVLLGGIASFEANQVTGDNFQRDVEQETLHVINRGRQMQVGDDLGYSGTLVIKNRNPATVRRDREFFELISTRYNKVWVKTPFGDVILIALGVVATDRQAGYGGHADFVDLTIPYLEIIDDDEAPIARQV